MAGIPQIAGTIPYSQLRRFGRIRPLPSFPVAANGQPLVVRLALGTRFNSLHIKFMKGAVPATNAEILDEVTNLKVVVDADPKFDLSAAELAPVQDFRKAHNAVYTLNANGVLVFDLQRPEEQEIGAQDGPAYGTATGVAGGINIAEMRVTLKSTSTITLVEGWAEEGDPQPLGRHLKHYYLPASIAGAGDMVFNIWPFTDPSTQIYGMHLQSSLVTQVKWYADNAEDYQRMDYRILQSVFTRYGLIQQAGWTHIPFSLRGRPLEGLPVTFQDGRLTLTCSGAITNARLIIECLEGVDPA